MEREEQRKKAQETALWNDRLGQMMDAARSSAERVVRAAQRLLPDRADAKELAWKAMLCQITAALKEGEEWKIAWRTHAVSYTHLDVYKRQGRAESVAAAVSLCRL